MSGPTVVAVRAALVQLWAPQVTDVRPERGRRAITTSSRRLVIGDAEGDVQPASLGPRRTMEETYSIACTISCTRNGSVKDQPAVTTEVVAWFAECDAALRQVPGENAGVPGVRTAYVAGDWKLTESPASETAGPINASLSFEVQVVARYSLESA